MNNSKSEKIIDIRFEDVLDFFGKHFFSLLVVAFLSGLLGFAYSYSYPNMYRATTTLLPEYGGGKKGSSLALLAGGINADGAEKLSPDLYPVILESTLFGIYLLKQPVTDRENKLYKSLELFLKRDSTQSLLSRLMPAAEKKEVKPIKVKLNDPNILSLSATESSKISRAMGLVSSSIDQKIGLITISAETKDPFVSSIVAESAKNYLVEYVEGYRTAKAIQQVDQLKEQVAAANSRFQKAEFALQSYRDRNRNPFLNVARIEEQRLQSDYVLAGSLHDDLVRRYEQAITKVKEEKPVFKVLEPAKVPLTKSSPKRVRFFLISAFLGGFAFLAYILLLKKNISKPVFNSPIKMKSREKRFSDIPT